MKGLIEEYGTFIVTAIIALIMISFLIISSVSPTGAIHRFIVSNMENVGAESQTIVEEWDIGNIKAVLKDDGGLYLSGTGSLPQYASINDTPWASQAGNITFVNVGKGVTVEGHVPYK